MNNNTYLIEASGWRRLFCLLLGWLGILTAAQAADTVKVGLTYPNTGRYSETGIDQARGALLAIEEINAEGGIIGRELELVVGSSGRKGREQEQIAELQKQGVSMAFGSSLTPRATAEAAAAAGLLYFDTLFHAPDERINSSSVFYESCDSWMAAKALAFYVNQQLRGQKLFYVSADNRWGQMTESILRKFTRTEDSSLHGQTLTRYPGPRHKELQAAFDQAVTAGANVLVLVQAGDDLAKALQLLYDSGLKQRFIVLAPNISLSVAREVGADVLEGVIATVPWSWQVARDYRYADGVRFTSAYVDRYGTHPSASAAAAYSVIRQYQRTADSANSLDARILGKALSGKSYSGLKDPQNWRALDHLSIQSVYVVKGRTREYVMQSELREDFFQVVDNVAGSVVAPTEQEVKDQAWQ